MMVKGVVQVIIGALLWVLAITVGVAWIGFCFGTVIIGILLLFFAPRILLFPPMFISVFANGFLLVGLNNIRLSSGQQGHTIDGEAEWVRTNDTPVDEQKVIEHKKDTD